MAGEDESQRKAEIKELSVLAFFSEDADDISVLYDKYWAPLLFLEVSHSCIRNKPNKSAWDFLKLGKNSVRTEETLGNVFCQKCLANVWFNISEETVSGQKKRHIGYSETVPKS